MKANYSIKIRKTINGISYTAVWKGAAFKRKVFRECSHRSGKVLYIAKLADRVFSDVILSPKISPDDFEDHNAFSEVFKFGLSVLNGDFEQRKNKTQLKKEVYEDWDLNPL